MSMKRGLSLCLKLYTAAATARMQLPFEVRHLAFELIDALSDSDYVVAPRVVDAFQRFGEPRNPGPKCFNTLMFASASGLMTWRADIVRSSARN
jgi:hypothetical protein